MLQCPLVSRDTLPDYSIPLNCTLVKIQSDTERHGEKNMGYRYLLLEAHSDFLIHLQPVSDQSCVGFAVLSSCVPSGAQSPLVAVLFK